MNSGFASAPAVRRRRVAGTKPSASTSGLERPVPDPTAPPSADSGGGPYNGQRAGDDTAAAMRVAQTGCRSTRSLTQRVEVSADRGAAVVDRLSAGRPHPAEWPGEQILFTAEQAGAALAVPGSWLRDKAAAGQIPCRRLGKHLRFARADLDTIAAEAAVAAHQPFHKQRDNRLSPESATIPAGRRSRR